MEIKLDPHSPGAGDCLLGTGSTCGAKPSDCLPPILFTVIGWPPLAWLVIDGKHLTKPPKDWYPLAQDTGSGTAYIEVRTCSFGAQITSLLAWAWFLQDR